MNSLYKRICTNDLVIGDFSCVVSNPTSVFSKILNYLLFQIVNYFYGIFYFTASLRVLPARKAGTFRAGTFTV